MREPRSTPTNSMPRPTTAHRHDNVGRAPGLTGEIQPTRPSMMVRLTIKPMSRVLNPVVRKVAGKRHMVMAAQIHHVGRSSGRAFMTPVGAKLSGVYFLVPLTFGNQSDWCRNVRAAGAGEIRCRGTDYRVVEPEIVDAKAAKTEIRSTFTLSDRAFMRIMGIKQMLRLRVAPSDLRSVQEA